MDRRRWVLAAAVGAGVRVEGQAPAAGAGLGKAEIGAALRAAGLTFSEAELEMMVRGAARARGDYERLRKIEIPYETEPAMAFHPGLAGRQPRRGRAVWRPTAVRARRGRPSDEDVAFATLGELGAMMRGRALSSVDLTRLYLARLKQYGPQLLCVVTLTEELALEQARRADADLKKGVYRGPLHGIPYGLKDLFATKGIRTTWGAEPFREQVPDHDSTVYERLRSAGGVLVAKLSMGALAMGGLWFGGMTKTPWNLKETSSGSSAGSAAATAAGLVGYAIGTETRGSIVSPAIRCGVVGLRPTYGRVPRTGAMALSWTMDKVGPICRGVEDCALVLNALYGPDGRDRTVTDAPFDWDAARAVGTLRIGYVKRAFDEMKGETAGLYAQALADLKKAGVEMKPVELPDETAQTLGFILSAEAAAAFDDITRDGRVGELKDQGPGAWPNAFRTARLIPAVDYIRAQRARTLLMEKMERFFEDWDVVVAPPYSNLGSTNLTGHPQVVVPCGFVGGAPQGLSFLGGLWKEGDALRVALAYERATEWHKRRPGMTA